MIRVQDVSLRLDGRTILDHLFVEVARGEAVALVGPNGSGKTSLLRCLLGLVPFEGRASIGGHDVVADPIAARSLVAHVPQRPAFGPWTARQSLRFLARLRELDEARIAPVLEQVGLTALADQSVRTFSVGCQQRLSVAAALLTQAGVLLLDEPTASLDRAGQQDFLALAARLKDQGATILLASHRAQEIGCLADREIHLEGGRVVHAGVGAGAGAQVAVERDPAAPGEEYTNRNVSRRSACAAGPASGNVIPLMPRASGSGAGAAGGSGAAR